MPEASGAVRQAVCSLSRVLDEFIPIITSQTTRGDFFTVVPCVLMLSKFYLPIDAQKSCFKRILKFTLKQLLHVSVQSLSSGSVLFELVKVIVIKIIG